MKMKIEDVPIEKIQTGDRYRRDYGHVESLAQSMREIGLLQPIGIDKDYNLVFGARRLHAATLIPDWKTIPCRIVDLESNLIGEHAENEFRKEFTPSERVAIAKAVERELGNRAGRPSTGNTEDLPGFPKGETREIAAKRAGFGNERTYRKAAAVVENGAPELVAVMDKKDISIDAAEAIVTEMTKEKQTEFAAMTKDKRRKVVRDVRAMSKAKSKKMIERDAWKQELAANSCERKANEFIRRMQCIARFSMDPEEFWATPTGRQFEPDFYDQFEQARAVLLRLEKAHPSTPKARPAA